VLPLIEGTITGTNGQPLSGVWVQPSGESSPAITDKNGHYAIGFLPGSSFTVTPALTNVMFLPGSRAYTNVLTSVLNEDYIALDTIGPALTFAAQGGSMAMKWFGLPGVTYQIYCSYDLDDWQPYGPPVLGANAPVEVLLAPDGAPKKFFKVRAQN
jgi:hypothetical protein